MTTSSLIISTVLSIFVPIISSILTMLLKRWINAKIETMQNEKMKELVREGTDIILDCVNYVQQTFVDNIKSNYTFGFGVEEQKKAFDLAKTRAIEMLPKEVYEAIDRRYGNVDKFVETIIESVIAMRKSES